MFVAVTAAGTGAMAAPGHDAHPTNRMPLKPPLITPIITMRTPLRMTTITTIIMAPAMPTGRVGISSGMTGTAVRRSITAITIWRPPPRSKWRRVDGNYVLAAAATGPIASIILAGLADHGRPGRPVVAHHSVAMPNSASAEAGPTRTGYRHQGRTVRNGHGAGAADRTASALDQVVHLVAQGCHGEGLG